MSKVPASPADMNYGGRVGPALAAASPPERISGIWTTCMPSSARFNGHDRGRRNPPPDPRACGRRQRFHAHSSFSHDRFRIWFRSRRHRMQRIGCARQNSLARSRCHSRSTWKCPASTDCKLCGASCISSRARSSWSARRPGRTPTIPSTHSLPEPSITSPSNSPPHRSTSSISGRISSPRSERRRNHETRLQSTPCPENLPVRAGQKTATQLFLLYRRSLPWGLPLAARELCRKSCLCFRETSRSLS